MHLSYHFHIKLYESHLMMLLPAVSGALFLIGRRLYDAEKRQVVDVHEAVRRLPGEGERGGVEGGDGEVTDGRRA